jgi:hypothetical protein
MSFIYNKIKQYDCILDNTFIIFWYQNSIYQEIKQYLYLCIHDIEDLHNDKLNELQNIEDKNNKLKNPVIIKGFN